MSLELLLKNDVALINGCKQNDRKAQEAVYRRYFDKMYAMCRRYTQDDDQICLIINDAFLLVFKNIENFEFRGSFEGWIRKAVVHTSINILKKNKKFNEYIDVVSMAEYIVQKEKQTANMQSKEIIECIRLLPVGYRTVLNLYAIEGYVHKEIAEMLGIEESTSRSQYVRAKQMLERMLLNLDILEPVKQKKRS
jgi:RNA polymerase sigma-70 factor (ECF subfamily)